MRAVLVFNILFLIFYGKLSASGKDPVPHGIEQVQVNRKPESCNDFFPDFSDSNPDYRLTLKNPSGGKVSGIENYAPDLPLISRNTVSDYSLTGRSKNHDSFIIRHKIIPGNFPFDPGTDLVIPSGLFATQSNPLVTSSEPLVTPSYPLVARPDLLVTPSNPSVNRPNLLVTQPDPFTAPPNPLVTLASRRDPMVTTSDPLAYRHDPYGGFLHQDHSSDSPKKSPSFNKQALKNIIPAIGGLAYVSFIFDEQVNTFARDNQTSFLNTMAYYTDVGGEKKIVVPGILLTYGTARFLLKNEKLQTTSLNAIQSVIVTAIATESVKNLAGRARPFTDEGPYTFKPFPGSSDQYKSLPSGHASLAFSLFTPFAETYSRWIYLVPVSVAAGRVYQDKHWLSDVVLGGGIGLVSGLLFTHYENISIIPNGLRIYF